MTGIAFDAKQEVTKYALEAGDARNVDQYSTGEDVNIPGGSIEMQPIAGVKAHLPQTSTKVENVLHIFLVGQESVGSELE